jgi:DNA-binding XRE family transcriptional regulator
MKNNSRTNSERSRNDEPMLKSRMWPMNLALPTTRLRAWRISQGFSQQHLADVAGVHPATISRAERGLTNLSAKVKLRLAQNFRVRVALLFTPPRNGSSK